MSVWLRSWGVSLRLARRGMLRAKGRSLLIIAMIGVPVLGLAFAAVTYDTFNLTPAEKTTRAMGSADAIVSWYDDLPLDADRSAPNPAAPTAKTDERLLGFLPPGSRAVRFSTGGATVRVRTATGVGRISSAYLPVGDVLTTGMVSLTKGTPPATDDEVSLTEAAAARLGASIGSKITLEDPAATYTVTAIVVIPDDLGEWIVLRPGVLLREPGGATTGQWLVDVPDGASPDTAKLGHAGIAYQARNSDLANEEQQTDTGTLTLATIAIGLTIFEVVLLCGPAFAVGARRRQRELALVAANGGTAEQIRRVTQADGILLGLSGAVGGLALGVPLAIVGRPVIEERVLGRLAGSLRFYPSALVAAIVLAIFTGLLASLVPAITAARQDVVAALAGRRGVGRSRKRWIIVGLLLTAAGGVVAFLGATTVRAELILTGLVLGQLGLVVLTPSLIGLLGRFGRTLPLTARIALRDTARNRSSAAPAISAVMAVVAGSVTIGIYFASTQARDEQNYQMLLPQGYAATDLHAYSNKDGKYLVDDAQLRELTSKISQALPVDRIAAVQTAECAKNPQNYCSVEPVLPESAMCPYQALPRSEPERSQARADERCRARRMFTSGAMGVTIVDDGTNLALLSGGTGEDLAKAQAMLRSGGVVVPEARYIRDGRVEVLLHSSDIDAGQEPRATLPAYALTSGVSGFGIVVGPSALPALGLTAARGELVVATTRQPTEAEQDAMQDAVADVTNNGWAYIEPGPGRPDVDLGLLVLAVASAIVTLAATAVVTGLAAADGRADLATLGAVGASPRVRRFMSLSQSGVIAGLGTALGVLAGAGGAYAMIFGINTAMERTQWPFSSPLPSVMPWTLLAAILVVPLIAMLGAGLLTRSRLPIERRS